MLEESWNGDRIMADFQKLAKEYKRMCNETNVCGECPIKTAMNGTEASCGTWILTNPEESERIITKWASEHPVKTNRQKFEEVFRCSIVTHEIHEAIPGHVKILNTSDEDFEEWLNSEYKGDSHDRSAQD